MQIGVACSRGTVTAGVPMQLSPLPTSQKAFRIVLFLVLWFCLTGAPGAGSQESESQTYLYSMKARVKLLFFWVGKDRVGAAASA